MSGPFITINGIGPSRRIRAESDGLAELLGLGVVKAEAIALISRVAESGYETYQLTDLRLVEVEDAS